MRKIPTLFVRGSHHRVTPNVNPECQWVIDGEGVATRKFDGTCVLVQDGIMYKRREVREGDTVPLGFVPAGSTDKGKIQGWMPVTREDQWHKSVFFEGIADGTYELIGEKINGNAEHIAGHMLVRHGMVKYEPCPRDYEGLRTFIQERGIEGIVFHHPDGRMAKIKGKDYDTVPG